MARFTSTPPWLRPIRDAARDLANVARFGRDAPRSDERLWLDPTRVTRTFHAFAALSGHVVRTWPPTEPWLLADHIHVRFARAHWCDGVPWVDTGVYEYMLEKIAVRGRQDGCRTIDDVVRRYARLDELYATVQQEGRLRTRQELDPAAHREDGGIFIHVAPDGEPFIGESGKHRLTIAQLLDVAVVPVRLGIIHREALDRLPAMRTQPEGG